jgi:hypothetical protein
MAVMAVGAVNSGGAEAMPNPMRGSRGWFLLLVFLLPACRDDDDGEAVAESGAALVTEGDVTQCGRTEDVYTNHTTSAKSLHVKVKNECWGRDTLDTDSARVWVRDAQGTVVNNQDVKIPHQGTHRGTFSVPERATLRIECPERLLQHDAGCSWEYKYSP